MPDHNREKGFTLIEAIAVLLIIAIIAVVVISRGISTADVDIKARAEALKSHIRYTQMRAMNMTSSNSSCAASFGMDMSGTNYSMFKNCTVAEKVVLPGAEANVITLPSGMTVTNTTFSFDNWGRPYSSDNPANPSGQSSSTISLTLGYQGLTETIYITQNTGYVQ
jgi:prepilin-type N-terminal cleavage/methylation domain-containing protein